MQVEAIYELKDSFGIDFENYIADELEKLGFKCFVSVYTKDLDIESQIDIIALCRYSIVCIECKSWNCIDVEMEQQSLNWSYRTIQGNWKQCRNPLRQCINQTNTLRKELQSLENIVRYQLKSEPYPCYSVVVLKGNAPNIKSRALGTSSKNTYFCNDLHLIKDRYLLEPNVEIDREVINLYSEYFETKQNNTEEKLKEHKEYIENCKQTKTGLWRPHIGVELYQI